MTHTHPLRELARTGAPPVAAAALTEDDVQGVVLESGNSQVPGRVHVCACVPCARAQWWAKPGGRQQAAGYWVTPRHFSCRCRSRSAASPQVRLRLRRDWAPEACRLVAGLALAPDRCSR